MTPEAVHRVSKDAVISKLTGRWEAPRRKFIAVLPPAGRIRDKAYEISRRYGAPLRDVASTDPTTSSAGKKVRIEEYAEALAIEKASCWKARQKANRRRRRKRSIAAPRLGPETAGRNEGSDPGSSIGNRSRFACMNC